MSYSMVISKTGSPDVLSMVQRKVPKPTAGEVLVRNQASAVNFIDTIIRRDEMPDGMMPDLPHVPGVEGAGIVEALGDGVIDLEVGDRVAWMGIIGSGGYGAHSIVRAPYVTKIACDIDFNIAAGVPVNAITAWHMMVNLGRATRGTTILVHAAAGGVGTMILQLAKHVGATTIASVSTDKQDYAREQGADYVIDYRKEDVSSRVLEITNGRGVDLTLNPVAGETLQSDMEALAPMGTAIVFGFLAGPPVGSFSEDLVKHFQRSIAIRVSDIYSYYNAEPELFAADMATIFDLLAVGVIRPSIFSLPLSEAAEAHRRLENGEVTGKLILTID